MMNISEQCELCGGKNFRIKEKKDENYNVIKCKKCGLVFVHPLPDDNFLKQHYKKEYYSEWTTVQLSDRINLWKKRLKEIKKITPNRKLLDIGCGEGLFLSLAQKEGFDVTGTEISEYACSYAKENFGLTIFNGNLKESHFPSETFNVITMWHVLEHLTNPIETLKEVNRIISDDGILIVAVPNLHNYLFRFLYPIVRMKKLSLFSCKDKELHLYHFTEKTLKLMLNKAGFTVKKSCLDMGQIEYNKRVLDWIVLPFYWLTRINMSLGIKVFAKKQ